MKKKLCVLFAGLLAVTGLGLAGCGKKDDRPVMMLYTQPFSEESQAFMDSLKKDFNKENNRAFQVDIKYFTDEVYNDALKTARENGTPPDIYTVSFGNLAADVRNGYASPLDDLLPADTIGDITADIKEMVTFDGKLMAYPWHNEPSTMLFYRKDMLEKAGVTEVPKTWQQLLDAAAKIKPTLRKGQYALGMPTGLPLGWATWGMQYDATGGLAVDGDYNIRLDSPEYRELCKYFYDIYHGGYAPAQDTSTSGYTNIVTSLCEDVLAMTYGGSWSITDIRSKYPQMKDKIGVAVIPTRTGVQTGVTATLGGWTFAVSKGAAHADWAAEFLDWAFYRDTQRIAEYYRMTGYCKIPASDKLRGYLKNDAEMEDDWYDTVLHVASTAKPEPQFSWDITSCVMSLFETMMTTNGSFQSVIDREIAKCVDQVHAILVRDGLV